MRRAASSSSSLGSDAVASPGDGGGGGGGGGGGRLIPSLGILRRHRPRGSRRHWLPDEKVDACMICGTGFTVTYRKHHCRRCGKVICTRCSHFVDAKLVFQTQAEAATNGSNSNNPAAAVVNVAGAAASAVLPKDTTRVCGPCAVVVTDVTQDKAAKAKEVVDGAILRTPAYVWALYNRTEELVVGSLSVLVVQARGLPAADRNGLSDPYAKLTLTGITIGGAQEWPEEMRQTVKTSTKFATLNPVWKEQFLLRVPRAEAVLRCEVKDFDFGLTNDSLGIVDISLAALLHQRRVDGWHTLIGNEDGEPKGEVRLILQYRFNRWGEALSRFWPEPPYVPDWQGFSPNRIYAHIMDLMREAELYQALLQTVAAILTWQRPLVTLPCLAVVLALTWYPRYIYSALQFGLAVYILYAYVCRRGRAQALELQQATGKTRRMTLREFVSQRRLTNALRRNMASAEEGEEEGPAAPTTSGGEGDAGNAADGSEADKAAAAARAEEEKKRQQEEQQSIASLGFVFNQLGKRLGRMEATTNLQNALGGVVKLLRAVRHLLEWEVPAVTSVFLVLLLLSAAAHLVVGVTYLFVTAELAVFGLLTWPLQTCLWWLARLLRVAASLAAQLRFALTRAVPGQIDDDAFALEAQTSLLLLTPGEGNGGGGGKEGLEEEKEEGAGREGPPAAAATMDARQ